MLAAALTASRDWWGRVAFQRCDHSANHVPADSGASHLLGASRGRAVMGKLAGCPWSIYCEPASRDRDRIWGWSKLEGGAGTQDGQGPRTALVLPFGTCTDEYRWVTASAGRTLQPGTPGIQRAPLKRTLMVSFARPISVISNHVAWVSPSIADQSGTISCAVGSASRPV